jgi:NADPH-dependent curcumin reductase
VNRFSEAEAQIAQWMKEGRINYREEMHEGLEHAPSSLQRLYNGENNGKLVIRLPAAKARLTEQTTS